MPIPSQLALGELSQELRSYLWLVVYEHLTKAVVHPHSYGDPDSYIGGAWANALKGFWVRVQHKFVDEFTSEPRFWSNALKRIFSEGAYVEVFDFVQWMIRANVDVAFEKAIQLALERGHSAYRIIDKTIMPFTSVEELETLQRALRSVEQHGHAGAKSHLTRAGEALTKGAWADSIRESIHAVESVVVLVAPDVKTLSDALKVLQARQGLNPNLKRGVEALYNYTSDEKGIRHALAFDEANADEADALFMLGACAAFITYLSAKFGQ